MSGFGKRQKQTERHAHFNSATLKVASINNSRQDHRSILVTEYDHTQLSQLPTMGEGIDVLTGHEWLGRRQKIQDDGQGFAF